jgi:hypothetical protein
VLKEVKRVADSKELELESEVKYHKSLLINCDLSSCWVIFVSSFSEKLKRLKLANFNTVKGNTSGKLMLRDSINFRKNYACTWT